MGVENLTECQDVVKLELILTSVFSCDEQLKE